MTGIELNIKVGKVTNAIITIAEALDIKDESGLLDALFDGIELHIDMTDDMDTILNEAHFALDV